MPRSGGGGGRSGGGRAPSRPSAPAPARAPQQQQQQRGMTTTAQPPARAQPPPAQASQSPGLFGQMASTAAGVAVGSSIGHAIGGFFGGGSSAAPEAAPAAVPAQSYDNQSYQQNSADAYAQPMDTGLYNSQSSSYGQQASGPCAADTAKFTQCFDKTGGDMSACGFYLEQLKACQQAAKTYAS